MPLNLNRNLANTQDLVAVDQIRDSTVILKDGKLLQVVMVNGMNTALKSETELDIISSAYRNFLNSLEFSVQIIIHSRKVNIKKYLDSLNLRREEEPSPLLQSQISEYKEFVAGFVRENDIMEKIFLVVVPFTSSHVSGKETVSSLSGFIPFLKKKSQSESKEKPKIDPNQEASFRENLEQLGQRVNQVVEGLKTIELQAVILSDRELVELFYNFYNPETVEREAINLPPAE